jgi:hypothetical protein
MTCSKAAIDTGFEVLDERREKMAALAQGALTLMRELRDQGAPSDAELIVEVLLDLLEHKDDLRQMREGLYRVAGLQAG